MRITSNMATTIIMILLGVVLILMVLLTIRASIVLNRNEEVFAYRSNLINRISDRAMLDVKEGNDPQWRYDLFDSVKYEDMVNKFWKPITSFYDEEYLLK